MPYMAPEMAAGGLLSALRYQSEKSPGVQCDSPMWQKLCVHSDGIDWHSAYTNYALERHVGGRSS